MLLCIITSFEPRELNASSWLERLAFGSKLHDDNRVSDKQCEVGLVTRTCHVDGCTSAPRAVHNNLTFFRNKLELHTEVIRIVSEFELKSRSLLHQCRIPQAPASRLVP